MPAPENGSFEVAAGVLPASWMQTSTSSAIEIADFGDASGYESFETGWFLGDFLVAFGISDIETALFDTATGPKPYEPFDSWEGLASFAASWPASEAAMFGVEAFDSFDAWVTLDPFDLDAALFDDGNSGTPAFDDFEGGWNDNQDFVSTIPAPDAALFGPGGDAYEDFESALAPNPFTVVPSADAIVTTNAHQLSNGDKFTVDLASTTTPGRLPEGLQPLTTYIAIVLGPNSVRASFDGVNAIDIQDQGAGAFLLFGDPTQYWTAVITL